MIRMLDNQIFIFLEFINFIMDKESIYFIKET